MREALHWSKIYKSKQGAICTQNMCMRQWLQYQQRRSGLIAASGWDWLETQRRYLEVVQQQRRVADRQQYGISSSKQKNNYIAWGHNIKVSWWWRLLIDGCKHRAWRSYWTIAHVNMWMFDLTSPIPTINARFSSDCSRVLLTKPARYLICAQLGHFAQNR